MGSSFGIGKPLAVKPLATSNMKSGHVRVSTLLLIVDIICICGAIILYILGKVSLVFLLLILAILPLFAFFPAIVIYKYKRLYPEIRVYRSGILLPYYQGLKYKKSFIKFSEIKKVYITRRHIIEEGIFDKWSKEFCNDIKSDVIREFISEELDRISNTNMDKDMGVYVVLKDGRVLMTVSKALLGDDIIALIKKNVHVV